MADDAGSGGRGRGTVRARTTLAATLILGMALLVGSVAMLTLLHRSLVRNLDDVADIRADDIAALARQGTLPPRLSLEDDAAGQVVADTGRVVATSPNLGHATPISTLRPEGELPPRTIDRLPGLSGPYRLLALRSSTPEGPVTIYVASSLEPVDETLGLVRTILLVGAPLLVLLVAAMTWTTVGRALRPVEAIRAQVAELSGHDVDRGGRVPVPATGDEIGRLARTMNAMLDRLQVAGEKQRRFVADASHELQTPLAAVRTELEVALAHPDARPWPDVALDLLDENGHMEQLVADLLFVARADDGTPQPGTAPTPIDLHEVVLDEVARLATTVGRRLAIDTRGVDGAFVLGRHEDLARAVRNLLDNAAHHARSTITIALAASNGDRPGHVTLVVDDDGSGVPPEDRLRIFERFTRLDDARSRHTGGTGLGLAIVREIAHAHDGHIHVEPAPTGGARFLLTLPTDP
jgi:signal transduction histidine kinase